MAIHDVDKTNSERTSPLPNSHDMQGIALSANGTTSINPVTDASGTSAYTQTANGRLLVNDGSKNRIIVGALPDGTFGMKVSQPTIDVTAATNSQLIFNSSQNMFKIVASGNATLTLNTTYTSKNSPSATTSVAHGLATIPALLAYFGMNNNNFPGIVTGTQYSMPYVTFGGGYRFGFSIDTTNVNFHFYNDSGSTADFSSTNCTATFKYYILQETAN